MPLSKIEQQCLGSAEESEKSDDSDANDFFVQEMQKETKATLEIKGPSKLRESQKLLDKMKDGIKKGNKGNKWLDTL